MKGGIKMKSLYWITKILVIIGAINWGLVGAFEWNLVEAIFGMGMVTKVIYILVGLSGLWKLIACFKK